LREELKKRHVRKKLGHTYEKTPAILRVRTVVCSTHTTAYWQPGSGLPEQRLLPLTTINKTYLQLDCNYTVFRKKNKKKTPTHICFHISMGDA